MKVKRIKKSMSRLQSTTLNGNKRDEACLCRKITRNNFHEFSTGKVLIIRLLH